MSERTVDQPARGGGRCPELGQAAADKALAFACRRAAGGIRPTGSFATSESRCVRRGDRVARIACLSFGRLTQALIRLLAVRVASCPSNACKHG
jgi:hypothetical protein